MSDYLFMLENHLNAEQNRVLGEVQACAAEQNLSLFLTGGAMRDMLAGFPIRDLDFTVEGNGVKLAKTLAAKCGATIIAADETKKSAELKFPGGVTVQVAMARQEKFTKPGGRSTVHPATIHEDLRGRDFTINAIALSLSRASRGLLLDPTNGLGDIESRELRAVSNYALYDDPARLLRLIRFKIRLGYNIADRTQSQYANVRESGLESKIGSEALAAELRNIANEDKSGEVLEALEQEKLIYLFSSALEGQKLNPQGFAKLSKARELVPFGLDFPVVNLGLFLHLLLEKLNAKERAALAKATGLEKEDLALAQKLETNARKLEKDIKALKFQKPSRLYDMLVKAPGEQLLFLLVRSTERIVQERIKNYLQKFLPIAQEVTDREVTAATELEPGNPKFDKAKREMIAQRLDAKPKKPEGDTELEAEVAAPPILANAPRFGTTRG
ncbi:MAG: hypothetical protein JSU00_28030 [Acidobacteria bacterium]|nr:hypothetical protein [Acidobacteriota bacterium]